MQKFVVQFGNVMINLCAWLYLIVLGISSLSYMSVSLALGVGFLIGGLVLFLFIFYLLYLLMSINSTLLSIESKLTPSPAPLPREEPRFENPVIKQN